MCDRAPTWARVPDIWNGRPRSPSTARCLQFGRTAEGMRGAGADLQPEGPLPPAGPGKPARQALALQEASAARGLVSHPVDRSVTAEAWCSWGGRGRGPGGQGVYSCPGLPMAGRAHSNGPRKARVTGRQEGNAQEAQETPNQGSSGVGNFANGAVSWQMLTISGGGRDVAPGMASCAEAAGGT